jgi:hypothetical protein
MLAQQAQVQKPAPGLLAHGLDGMVDVNEVLLSAAG